MRIDVVQWFSSKQPYLKPTAFAVGVVAVVLFSCVILTLTTVKSANSVFKDGKKRLRTHAPDDDELHDQEIYEAVVNSMAELEKAAKKRHRVKRDEEIVCYGELGCFRDEGPFDYLDMLPSPPEEIETTFLVYTRKNANKAQVFSFFNFTTMHTSHFNASLPSKVIVHGFGSTCNRMWASEMRQALLSVVECNVICVDWENGASTPNYVRAAVNTRLVGKQVAILIRWLNEHLGSRTQDFHFIGFSLGAHVAGFTGQELKNLSRITGLDPAGPLFESYDNNLKLDSSDALFVDVIHSNGDSLLMGGLGSWEPIGHVDFYPNGGRVQKGCSNLFVGAVRDFLWSSAGDGRSLCNHRRAYKFFTESVSPRCPFPAFSCESYDKYLTGACFSCDVNDCGNMGYYADRLPNPKKGLLYLITREEEPFCANQYRIRIESSPSPAPISTYGGLEAIMIGHDFINETFMVTQSLKDNMVAGSVLQRIVVAHPAITEPVKIQLKYTAYQGWLYSGISRWSMDRLILTNAYGKSLSFCTKGLLLPSDMPVTVTLTPGICVNHFPPSTSNIAPATNAIRPVPMYPYETYPSVGISENAIQTAPHPSISSPHLLKNTTIETDAPKVPALNAPTYLDGVKRPISSEPTPTIHQNDISYYTDTNKWPQTWQPVSRPPYGTPVVTFPPENYSTEDQIGTTLSPFSPSGYSSQEEGKISETGGVKHCRNISSSGECMDNLGGIKQNEINIAHHGKPTFGFIGPLRRPLPPPSSSSPSVGNNDPDPVYDDNDLTSTTLSEEDNKIPSYETAIKVNKVHSRPHTVNYSEDTNAISFYQPPDPDVVLPPQLQFILNQLESQGLGPNSKSRRPISPGKHGATTSAANKYRHLIPSSRSLKPRPVLLSNHRRQSKSMDLSPPGNKMNGPTRLRRPPAPNSSNNNNVRRRGRQRNLERARVPIMGPPENTVTPKNSAPGYSSVGESTQRSFTPGQRGNVASVVNHYPMHGGGRSLMKFNDEANTGNSGPPGFGGMKPNGFYVIPVYSYDASRGNQLPMRQGIISRRVLPPPPAVSMPRQESEFSNRNKMSTKGFSGGNNNNGQDMGNNGFVSLQQAHGRSNNGGQQQRRRTYFEAYEDFRSLSNNDKMRSV